MLYGFKYFSLFLRYSINGYFGDIMEKKIKLAILGIIAFFIVIAIFVYYTITSSAPPVSNTPYFSVQPYFVKEYLDANPDYKPTAKMDITNIKHEKLSLSNDGFSASELVIDAPTILRISNSSSEVKNIAVTSPSLDGTFFAVSNFAINSNSDAALGLLVAPYTGDILNKSNAKVEKTDKGILVFEISCVNCNEASNYLKVYAKLS